MTAILHIAQDNLFTDRADITVDYLSTGITITPGVTAQSRGTFSKLPTYVARWLTGRYEWLIVPAMNFSWHADPTRRRRNLRRLIGTVTWRPVGRKTIFQHLNPQRTRICVLDRFDTTEVFDDFADAVGAEIYFKTNVRLADQARYHDRPWRLEFVPLWIATDRYPEPAYDKKWDLFYAAAPVSAARRNAHADLESLRQAGVRVRLITARLPFVQFAAEMSSSWLTLSPEGYGYHCFRHSEAMLMESVPVINRPTVAVISDLRHEDNCLLYDSEAPGDLCRVVQTALANKPRLARWTKEIRRYAITNYSREAVGDRIVSRLGDVSPSRRGDEDLGDARRVRLP